MLRINRTALRQAVEAAITAHKARHEAAAAKWAAVVDQHRVEWLDKHGDAWIAAARSIARKAKKGEVITEQDLPRVAGSTAVYRAPYSGFRGDVRDPGVYRAPRELVALAGVLDAIVDEEITHTGIRSLGITSATLRDAISHIGRVAV